MPSRFRRTLAALRAQDAPRTIEELLTVEGLGAGYRPPARAAQGFAGAQR
jgi:hypothetical protein